MKPKTLITFTVVVLNMVLTSIVCDVDFYHICLVVLSLFKIAMYLQNLDR